MFIDTKNDEINEYIIVIALLDDSSTYLELFQIEIKLYLNSIISLKEDINTVSLDWKNSCVLYLPRFAKYFKPVLAQLIFSAIQGFQFVYKNIPQNDIDQIIRFTQCFGILDIKEKQKSDTISNFAIEQEIEKFKIMMRWAALNYNINEIPSCQWAPGEGQELIANPLIDFSNFK